MKKKGFPLQVQGKTEYFSAKKHLGQNFLNDKKYRAKIIEACTFHADDVVLEIGPGMGALTYSIAPLVRRLILVEKDPVLAGRLQEEFKGSENVEVIRTDFLKLDFEALPKGIKVVGNLPYYITTPIITRVLEKHGYFRELYMTVQWEFGQRLIASPHSKEYGSFTIFAHYYSHPQLLFKIPASAFNPRPKVDSCFMKLSILDQPSVKAEEKAFFRVVRAAFMHRRKTLLNALSALKSKEELAGIFQALAIDPQARAEQLSIAQYAALAEACKPVI